MKVTASEKTNSVTFKTTDKKHEKQGAFKWWTARSKAEAGDQMLSTAVFLKENQQYRYRQAATYARLYGNLSLSAFVGGSTASKMDQQQSLPLDRPTFNLIQSSTDTLVSRITQQRPSPVFLTDNSDYKERNLAKKLNQFILGEFYQTEAYKLGEYVLRDALVEGTGCLHVYETDDERVGVERVLLTELMTDPNESLYGKPRQLYRFKLMDRAVLNELFDASGVISKAENAYPDGSANSSKSASDLVMVVEAWRLPSSKKAKDGRHMIACSAGVLLDEAWDKDRFPFVFLHYSARLVGFWAQGLAEQLMGTQIEINSLLFTISKAIKLVGVPRVFQEEGSKVSKAAHNNDIGTIITYRGVKPSYEVAPCVPEELYAQLQRLIQYGYQQCGVSSLAAGAQKPAGLDSGEAIRTYDDISSDRFAALARRYDNMYIDLAYLIMDFAMEIAKRTGKYSTVYPNKDGTKEINLPEADLLQDPFVIQCFNMSSLPRDPAGRMQKITEMLQSGMISIKEGRRLLDYPDLGQIERLANASEERIFQLLDKIVDEGEFTQPDPFMDLLLAKELTVQYYNLYVSAKLEEERAQMLRDFYSQVLDLAQASAAPPPQDPGMNPPQANPEALPTSPLIPNGNQPGAMPGAGVMQ